MATYKTLLFCAPTGPIPDNAYFPVGGSCSHLTYDGAETVNWSTSAIRTVGTISKLAAKRGGAGAASADTLSLRLNGVNTSLSVTTTGYGDQDEDAIDAISISDNDLVTYDHTVSCDYSWIRALFEPSTDGTQVSLFALRGNGPTLGAYLATTDGTNYLPFCGGTPRSSSINTDESLAQIKLKTAGTFRNVAVRVVYNTATSAVTLRSRKNGANGNIAITIPAGVEGFHTNTSDSDTLAVDDEYCFSVSAPASGRVEFCLLTCEYDHATPTGDHEIFCGNPGQTQTLEASASTKYIRPVGDLFNGAGEVTAEADAAVTLGLDCGAELFRLKVTSNDCTNDQVFAVLKNGVATALTFTVPATDTGEFIDSTHSISLLATDTVSFQQTGGGTGGLGVEYFALLISGEAEAFETGDDGDECGSEDEADVLQDTITWPKCDLVPTSISVDVVAPSVSPGRSFSGFEQLVQADAGYWRIVYNDVPIRTRARALQWREIESLLDGRNNPILVPVYEAPVSAVDIVAESGDGNIGDTSLNLIQSAGGDIEPGMHFSTPSGYLHRIKTIEQVAVEEISLFSMTIWPPLREALAGSELEFNDPVCRCRLETDDGMDVNLELLRFGRPSVAFVEDV